MLVYGSEGVQLVAYAQRIQEVLLASVDAFVELRRKLGRNELRVVVCPGLISHVVEDAAEVSESRTLERQEQASCEDHNQGEG